MAARLASPLRRRARRLLGAAIVLYALPASGQVSPYCAKVRERAADDAALLVAPRLVLQALRFPDNGRLEGGTIVGQGVETRAGLAYSVTDLYKGLALLRVADADCRAHEARSQLEAAVGAGDDGPRAAALRAEIAFLESRHAEVQDAVAHAAARFEEHVITLVELGNIRDRADALERKLLQARGQAAEIEARRGPGEARATPPSHGLARTYADAAGDLDRATERVRSGEPWQLDMAAGIIPSSRVDWYGIVQLGFNLGGLARSGHAARFARAHEDEIAHAPYELGPRVSQHRQQLIAKLEESRAELTLVDRQLETVQSTAQALDLAEAPHLVHQREVLALDGLALEAERAFQSAYLAALQRAMVED